jgi:hypothetical protein
MLPIVFVLAACGDEPTKPAPDLSPASVRPPPAIALPDEPVRPPPDPATVRPSTTTPSAAARPPRPEAP